MLQIPFNCTGCHACASICPKNCIQMQETGEGFPFPVIDTAKCIQCSRCEKVCPVLQTLKGDQHTLAFAVKSKNSAEREISTSGGVFPLLAEWTLNKGGIVFGAAYDEDFAVRHVAVADRKMLCLLQGAKYTQSVIGTSFREAEKELKSGRQVLFSGTPCQCAGLKSYLGKEYDNLLLVDLICHGVPSPKVWQDYIDYRSLKENDGKRPVKINMRSKSSGWSRYGYSTEFDYGNGKVTRIHNSQDLFMKAFVGNICLRSSCSDCKAKGVERCTDVTLGDYWGIWNQHPEFDDNKGTSVVFVHSQKGRMIMEQLQDEMDCLEVEIEDAYKENGSLINSSAAHPARAEFFERVTADNFEELIHKYFPQESRRAGILQKIRSRLKK